MHTQTGHDLLIARELLQADSLVAIPTETVYGLAGNALSAKAVLDIFEVKDRPSFDPLIVHVAGIERVSRYAAELPRPALQLMERFWPGPLTILLPKKEVIPDIVTSGLPNVALRMPDHPLTLELLASLDFPLAAPSANPFGYISPTTAGHVYDQLKGKIPYILNGGPCTVGVESTIVSFAGDTCRVHRLGGMEVEELEAVVGKVELQLQSGSNPAAPGMLPTHYAPRKPLLIGNLENLLPRYAHDRVGVLSFSTDYPDAALCEVLSPSGDIREAARELFAAMRRLDAAAVDVILAEAFPDKGLGRAINDRLRRASQ